MTDVDPAAFEERYRALEAELGALDLGGAFLMLTGLDEKWLRVLHSELQRIADLRFSHYAEHEGPTVVRVGSGKVVSSRDELTAAVAFIQGVTFAEALRQERKE